MSVFVLVHGGFSGGWYYRQAAQSLRKYGHEVFTPTLTGLGERVHLANPKVGLDTHIQDIVSVLECEDLQKVILLGHSSGVMVITGVAEKVPERLSRLVYLDAPIPKDGQSYIDLLGPEVEQQLLDLAKEKGDGWRIPLVPNPPRWQPHPLKAVTDSLEVKNPAAVGIPRAFIHCTVRLPGGVFTTFWPRVESAAEGVKRQGLWYRALPTDHMVSSTEAQQQLAQLLLEMA